MSVRQAQENVKMIFFDTKGYLSKNGCIFWNILWFFWTAGKEGARHLLCFTNPSLSFEKHATLKFKWQNQVVTSRISNNFLYKQIRVIKRLCIWVALSSKPFRRADTDRIKENLWEHAFIQQKFRNLCETYLRIPVGSTLWDGSTSTDCCTIAPKEGKSFIVGCK